MEARRTTTIEQSFKEETCDHVFRLGWISNYGDAASRACQLQYAGGGSGAGVGVKKKESTKTSLMASAIKEYVHVVHATLCHEETLQWVLLQQQDKKSEKETLLTIPRPIAKYMVSSMASRGPNELEDDNSGGEGFVIPINVLEEDSQSMDQQQQDHATIRSLHNVKEARKVPQIQKLKSKKDAQIGKQKTKSVPKFPTSELTADSSETDSQERLSCPYQFLFGT